MRLTILILCVASFAACSAEPAANTMTPVDDMSREMTPIETDTQAAIAVETVNRAAEDFRRQQAEARLRAMVDKAGTQVQLTPKDPPQAGTAEFKNEKGWSCVSEGTMTTCIDPAR